MVIHVQNQILPLKKIKTSIISVCSLYASVLGRHNDTTPIKKLRQIL